MKPNLISPATRQVGVAPQTKPLPLQGFPVEADGRDINRLNAQGRTYAGYHVNHDTDLERRPRTAGVLA